MRSLFLLGTAVTAVAATEANPIRKIVTLLQDMKKEIEAEGEKNQDLYEKFMCFCKKNKGSLGESAAAAQAQIDELTAKVKADSAEKAQLESDLAQHKADRTAAKKDLATAEALREKEHNAFLAESGDTKANLDAVSKAIPALEQGMGATGFIQTEAGVTLKRAIAQIADSVASDDDRSMVMAFLEQKGDYAPQSGQIVGILKNMKDEMEKALAGILADEEAAVKGFGELKAAKEKEIAAAGSAIESKTERAGKLAVSVVQAKAEAENASEELADSQKFAAELEENCATKTDQHKERQKLRADEVLAIGEAINVLNDDDALDIFNKTLKKPETAAAQGFLQVRNTKANRLAKTRALLASMKIEKNPGFALLQAAAVSSIKSGEKSGKVDFSKVLKMIDDMVALLKQEQKDDLESRDWCNEEFDKSADEKKDTEAKVASLESTIAEVKDSIATLAQEIADTKAKIAALDQSVAEAGEQRSQEHKEFEAQQALNQAAIQLIFKAKNRLQKFYNPQLYVAPKERELTREEQILQGAGQEVDPIAQPELIHGTTQTVFVQLHQQSEEEVEPPVAPGTGSYKKSGQKGASVTALMDMLTKEVETDVQAAEHAEKTAQKEYEALVADAQETRAQDTKTVVTAEASKADQEAQLDEAKNGHSLASDQLAQVKNYIAELHGSCDFILANFVARKEARTNEIDGLGNAKAVLSGADYSF